MTRRDPVADSSDHEFRLDVAVTVVTFVGTVALVMLLPAGNPVRVVAGLVALLCLPGHALTTLVFPARSPDGAIGFGRFSPGRRLSPAETDTGGRSDEPARASLSGVERAALTVGLSVALVPLYGFVLGSGSLLFNRPNVVGVVVVVTAGLVVAGAARRKRVDPRHRYVLPFRWVRRRADDALSGERRDVALNVGLAAAVLLASVSFTAAVVAPADGTTDTGATLLTEQPNGELAATGYETEFTRGDRTDLVLEVANREGETVEYTAVVLLHRLNDDGTVVESERVRTLSGTAESGERWRADHTVTMEMAGDRIRLRYLLYRGDPPATPTVDSAYRRLSLSVSVEAA